MVVGEGTEAAECPTTRGEGAAEALRIADPAKRGDPGMGQIAQRPGLALRVDQVEWRMPRLDPAEGACAALRLATDRRAVDFGHQVGPREDNDPRPAQRGYRLPEQAAREHVPVAERVECVDQHEVEVARQ